MHNCVVLLSSIIGSNVGALWLLICCSPDFYAAKLALAGSAVASVAVHWRSSDCLVDALWFSFLHVHEFVHSLSFPR